MNNTKKVNWIFVLFYLGDALLSPFLALNFIHLGFDSWQRGILLALKPLIMLLGNIIFGHFSKGFKRDVNIMKILLGVTAIGTLGFAFATSFWLNVALMVIWSLTNGVAFSFADGIAEKVCAKENKKYALIRIFGSIGYAIGLIFGGFLGIANALNYQIIFSVSALLTLISMVLLFFIKPFDTLEVQKDNKISTKELFKSKNFVKYMIFYFFVMGIWKVADDYCSTFFNGLGLSDGEWSFLYAGEVAVEVITILICNRFIKKDKTLIQVGLFSAILIALRSFLFSLPLDTISLAITTGFLRGFSFGLFLVSFMVILGKMLGTDYMTKGVALLAVEQAIFSTVGNFFYLQIESAIGSRMLYLIFGLLQCVGIIAFLFIDFSFKKEKDIIKTPNSDTIESGDKTYE